MRVDNLDFQKMGGLLPVVIQDYIDGSVLMLGFMNEEAWKLTINTGKVHYYSRKKKRIWMKGEQSGHFQHVREVFKDNDDDTLLIKVNQIGGAVEDGYRSCFFHRLEDNQWSDVGAKVFDPKKVYERYSDTVVFAIPSGSLYSTSIMLLTQAGFPLSLSGDRSFKPVIKDCEDIKLVVANAREIPRMIQDGQVDIGLAGLDLINELGVNLTMLTDLKYNKNGLGEIYWVLCVPTDNLHEFNSLRALSGKVVSTELPNTVRQFFAERKIPVQVHRSAGTTEAKAPFLCDAIVDICETGKTLSMNGLTPIYRVKSSTVHLCAHNESMGYGWKRRKIQKIAAALQEAYHKLPSNPKRLISLPDSKSEKWLSA